MTEKEINEGSEGFGREYWEEGEEADYKLLHRRTPHEMFVCGVNWAQQQFEKLLDEYSKDFAENSESRMLINRLKFDFLGKETE